MKARQLNSRRLLFKIIHIMYSHTTVLVYMYGDLACGSV